MNEQFKNPPQYSNKDLVDCYPGNEMTHTYNAYSNDINLMGNSCEKGSYLDYNNTGSLVNSNSNNANINLNLSNGNSYDDFTTNLASNNC